MTSLLVLGGSHFVGRAVVTDALDRGWEVTTFNRGGSPPARPAVRTLTGDRTDPSALHVLGTRDWDLVVDTWSGSPRATAAVAGVLAGHAARYAYISSASVYVAPPVPGATEAGAVVAGDPGDDEGEYPALKRGSELALIDAFGDRALLARAGLILGPYENVGRLTWWLARMARGGEVLCPAPAGLPLQYVDARDLAAFVIEAATAGHGGPVNVVSRRGHATIGSLLRTCRDVAAPDETALTWVDGGAIEAAGITPWETLPIWLPADHEYAAMHDIDVTRAHAWGLRTRPVTETVTDTWRWLTDTGGQPPLRPGAPVPGVAPAREREVLSAWHAAG